MSSDAVLRVGGVGKGQPVSKSLGVIGDGEAEVCAGDERRLGGSSGGGVVADVSSRYASGILGGTGGKKEDLSDAGVSMAEPELAVLGGSSEKFFVELVPGRIAVSHPYMSDKLPLLLLYWSFPLKRRSQSAVETVLSLAADLEVCVCLFPEEAIDCLDGSGPLLSRSLAPTGTPSHFELTLGTVGGSLAEETPGNPTAVTRPP